MTRMIGSSRAREGGFVHGAGLIPALLIAVAALVTIARRLQIAYPIFLVIRGLILGVVPGHAPDPDRSRADLSDRF